MLSIVCFIPQKESIMEKAKGLYRIVNDLLVQHITSKTKGKR